MSKSLPASAEDLSANDNDGLQIVPMLIALSKSVNALLGLRLAAIGLRTGQDEALMALHATKATTAAELAHKLRIRPATAQALLSGLGEKGLVECDPSGRPPAEGVMATPAGTDARHNVHQMHRQLEAELVQANAASPLILDDLRQLQQRLMDLLASLR